MSSPELVAKRLEELLAGSFPETHDEARLQGLARELRSASVAAPSSLRERVERLQEAPKRRVAPSRRLVALAFASVALVVGAAFGSRLYFSGSGQSVDRGQAELVRQHATPTAVPRHAERSGVMPPMPTYRSFPTMVQNLTARAQEVDMWMDLRVKDADAVSSVSQEAQRITRELGGVVGSSSVSTEGKRGSAQMTLRIPVENVDEANFRLSQLGTVTGQKIETQDLQAPLDVLRRRIERLRSGIRIELARIASGTLDQAEELRARVQLEHLRRHLREAKASRASIVRRTSMADLIFRFGTGTPTAADKSEGGIAGAVDKAGDFLRGGSAVAVFLVLVLSPLLVLTLIAWALLRARNRRIEARLLDDPQPGTQTRSS